MSSPMMTRMFGFCGCCAKAGAPALNAAAVTASTPAQMFEKAITHSRKSSVGGKPFPSRDIFYSKACTKVSHRDRRFRKTLYGQRTPPQGRPHHPQASELLARVPLTLLELVQDLIQVVARRILKGRELLVGF